ncbi:hypothetical protein CYMTET_11684, partial [Cymbomonas tetramitiformis]
MEAEAEEEDISGYLYKRGDKGPVRNWKRRWFSSRYPFTTLTYKESEDVTEILGEIPIAKITHVERVPNSTCFNVSTPGRVYMLKASNVHDVLVWKNFLESRGFEEHDVDKDGADVSLSSDEVEMGSQSGEQRRPRSSSRAESSPARIVAAHFQSPLARSAELAIIPEPAGALHPDPTAPSSPAQQAAPSVGLTPAILPALTNEASPSEGDTSGELGSAGGAARALVRSPLITPVALPGEAAEVQGLREGGASTGMVPSAPERAESADDVSSGRWWLEVTLVEVARLKGNNSGKYTLVEAVKVLGGALPYALNVSQAIRFGGRCQGDRTSSCTPLWQYALG